MNKNNFSIGDYCYVVDWGQHYPSITRWNNKTNEKENIFPIKTKLPDYSGTDHHWKYEYESNLTLQGTINKRKPKKLIHKTAIYKDYKWKVIEIFKHPQAGKLFYDLDKYTQEQLDIWKNYSRYTENNLLLLASTHTDIDHMKCYIVIEESGVSKLTPEQFKNKKFNALIESNLGIWDPKLLTSKEQRDKIPKEIISVFYDKDDTVLFGSSVTKGLVTYHYLDEKFSVNNKRIYLGSSILYDGKGIEKCPDKSLIKPFSYIQKYMKHEE